MLFTVAKRKSLFDDKSEDIEELTVSITSDIGLMNQRLAQLESVQQRELLRKQALQHSSCVVDALKGKLHSTASSFDNVLRLRSDNLKSQESRRKTFSAPSAMLPPSHVPLMTPPPNSHGHHQLALQTDSDYLQSRGTMVEQVESHIVELGQIFSQLSQLVADQDELFQRIDENVNDTLINVEGAHNNFLTYYRNISSNRKLLLSMFAVLIIFIFIFGMFM
eukprot:c7681_g1_i1.p1 GENE.c7681_g1_i1~~c7681_g1_i1.p1  ORF type:complete len:221 (-),score=48.44 c7681_g1_i1:21-683(-)